MAMRWRRKPGPISPCARSKACPSPSPARPARPSRLRGVCWQGRRLDAQCSLRAWRDHACQACAADVLLYDWLRQATAKGKPAITDPPQRAGMPAMKPDTPRPILLKDYRPPNYLIYAVDLDVALHPIRTRVRSSLKIKRNPAYPGSAGPLRLDGEMIELEALRLDGRQLAASDYRLTDRGLT